MSEPERHYSKNLLAVDEITKAFPGVQAISSAAFDLRPGEIHALVGENGAGKSTLIKILSGVYPPDSGKITINGEAVSFKSPIDAGRFGIATIYQEFTLIPSLSVSANLFLGRERKRLGIVDVQFEREAALRIFERLAIKIDPGELVSDLSVAEQQIVEISRALLADARILVMDEPTAALTPREVDKLFEILDDLKARRIGIIFISHRLDEVFRIADRITVMRDGKTIMSRDASSIIRSELIERMVGRPLDKEFPARAPSIGKPLFKARGISGGPVKDITFEVGRGEILGITGLMGAGRTELARLLFGADPREGGEIFIDGRQLKIRDTGDAIRNGLCLLTEDRKGQGLVSTATAKENFALPNMRRWSNAGIINKKQEMSRFSGHVKNLNIRIASPDQKARDLSGGNQQKILVARWLESNSQVVIFDEPTRGIDVGAKHEMYLLINELADKGKAIIMISSELPEILGMCDRILVMRDGRISGEITDMSRASQESIMSLAI